MCLLTGSNEDRRPKNPPIVLLVLLCLLTGSNEDRRPKNPPIVLLVLSCLLTGRNEDRRPKNPPTPVCSSPAVRCQYTVTGLDSKFDLQLLSQCDSMYNYLKRSVPGIHYHVVGMFSSHHHHHHNQQQQHCQQTTNILSKCCIHFQRCNS